MYGAGLEMNVGDGRGGAPARSLMAILLVLAVDAKEIGQCVRRRGAFWPRPDLREQECRPEQDALGMRSWVILGKLGRWSRCDAGA